MTSFSHMRSTLVGKRTKADGLVKNIQARINRAPWDRRKKTANICKLFFIFARWRCYVGDRLCALMACSRCVHGVLGAVKARARRPHGAGGVSETFVLRLCVVKSACHYISPLQCLKLKFSQYSSIHTNYIIPNCTTLQYDHNI